MAYQISPGVSVRETDLTNVVPAVSSADAAFAAAFSWGPDGVITQVNSENQLVSIFGAPTGDTEVNFLTAASFLAYAGSLNVVRTVGAGGAAATSAGFNAKYKGIRGNGIEVHAIDAATYSGHAYEDILSGIPETGEVSIVVVDNDQVGSAGTPADGDNAAVPASADYQPATVLEVYEFVSLTEGTKYATGASSFIGNVLGASSYIELKNNGNVTDQQTLAGGNDGTASDGATARIAGYQIFADPDAVDISLIIAGQDDDGTITQSLVTIAEARKDCVVFSSAPTSGDADDILASSWYAALPNSSYLITDSGYKTMYNRYLDGMAQVPLNGDIAGLCVFTDDVSDPWFSPAGINRGSIKNVVNLVYSPTKIDRDKLYKASINPVASFTGQGTILFGDKTFLNRPSSFDRINVRRLMIFLEKMIGRAARSLLFEFNDEFTRATFVNMVTPTLRDVQGRRGISEFLVICDESNNTPEVIDRNEFVGSILVKPNRSINFIQLNFVAVRTGVEFSEVAL